MKNNLLLLENNFSDFGLWIACGLILSCSLYYLIRSNNVANLPNNTEPLINQEIEAINNENMGPFREEEIETIFNENMVPVSNSNIDDILTDSDLDTVSEYENISDYDSASSDDFYEIFNDPDLYMLPPFESKFKNVEFIMPDLDFNVCSLEELKLFEFCSLYHREMAEHSITEEEMMEIIGLFPERDLATNWINDLLLAIVELL
jgi:hypothetical protein